MKNSTVIPMSIISLNVDRLSVSRSSDTEKENAKDTGREAKIDLTDSKKVSDDITIENMTSYEQFRIG